MTSTNEHLERVEIINPSERADPRLGRQLVHDRRSRNYPGPVPAAGMPRTYVRHRVYNPRPNPSQVIGNCTGVAEVVSLNARGNRARTRVLTMAHADAIYERATRRDPFPGEWPPEDTGSSGLAAGMAAIDHGLAVRVEWYFGLEATLNGLQLGPVSVGGYWRHAMWTPDPDTLLVPYAGAYEGGHQWVAMAHDPDAGWVEGVCWWGSWPDAPDRVPGRFRMSEDALGRLLEDGGDVHRTVALAPNAAAQ